MKLHIIGYLSDKDASNQEIFESLTKVLNVKYRSAVYSCLKDLNNVGIVEKYYDNKDNKIKYRLIIKAITLDLEKMSISLSRRVGKV